MTKRTDNIKIVLKARWRLLAFLGLGLVGVFFRAWHLSTLPPGLSSGEASIGLSALNLIHHGTWPGLNAGDAFAPLWTLLQALPVWLFGHAAVALRLWPVAMGTLAVFTTWLWAKDWFDERIAWVSAVLMAVTPWAVTMSRSASPAVLVVALTPFTLWAAARALTRNSAKWWWATAALLVIELGSGPLGWGLVVLAIGLAIIGAWSKRRTLIEPKNISPIVVIAVALAGAAVIVLARWNDLKHLFLASQLTGNLATIASTLGHVAAMFNLHGDDSFLHNFGSEPMLNAFVGLMFIAGLLVSLTRLPRRRYIGLLKAFGVGLILAVVSPLGAPNAAHAALLLPVVMVLAGIGTSYMLELWYTTFPINSAARSTGLAAILLLLGLTVFQGYVQTFRAWSGSAETYLAYDEAAVATAAYLKPTTHTTQYVAGRFVVATPDEQQVIDYLTDSTGFVAITPTAMTTLPAATGSRQFVITVSQRDQAARNLATKFAGGKLVPHVSSFSQNELFYTYETAQ